MAENHYLMYSIFLMLLGGTFKVQTQNAMKKKLFQIWRVLLNLNILYVFVAVSVDFAQKGIDQFDSVVLNFVYIFISVIVLLRANYYFFFDGKSEDILKEMHRLFKYRTETQFDEKGLKKCVDLSRRITAIWFVFGITAAYGFILMSLIVNTSSERQLPLPFWFPYNWKISPFYELSILYQCFIHQIMVIIIVGTDMFYASVVMLTSEQFTLLGWEIKQLLFTVLLKNGVNKEVVNSIRMFINRKSQAQEMTPEEAIAIEILNELLALQKIKTNLLEDLKRHIQFHQSLLKFCHRLEDFFSPMYLPYFFIIFIIDVFLSFIITTTKEVTLVVTVGLYMVAVTITLMLACYFGQLITMRAEALPYDVYDSPWYICDENFKLHIKYLHFKTCKPIVLTVGKIAPLHLNTFLWISKTAVSYVTILYQLTEENRR